MPSIEISGKLSQNALADFSSLFSILNNEFNYYTVFAMRQEYDIPIGTIFYFESKNNINTDTFELIAVTQQYNFLAQEIPKGWNTICAFKAISPPPCILDSLPIIDDWYGNNKTIRLVFTS